MLCVEMGGCGRVCCPYDRVVGGRHGVGPMMGGEPEWIGVQWIILPKWTQGRNTCSQCYVQMNTFLCCMQKLEGIN